MARISLRPPRTLTYRLAEWYSRRKFGVMLDPGKALGHHTGVLRAYARHEMAAVRWRRADRNLKDLAVMAAAARIGCSWCLDFGQWELRMHGIAGEKIHAVTHWRDSALFTDAERLALEYAEAMSATPPEVTDDLVARLRAHLDDGQLVELTAMIALENLRSRLNTAFGLTGQGFSDRCDVPQRQVTASGSAGSHDRN
jgi:AhpD family alkylhydroperoxidase